MIDPPIDKLIKKAECRYALVCGIAKRAKQLQSQDEERLRTCGKKAISVAAQEIFDGDVLVNREN
jgi:DNA-directed RNA polymerase omega subunit